MTEERFLTLTETAALCRCSVQTIRNWREKRAFPEPVGVNYSLAAVLKWCRDNGVQVSKPQGV